MFHQGKLNELLNIYIVQSGIGTGTTTTTTGTGTGTGTGAGTGTSMGRGECIFGMNLTFFFLQHTR